ncbi:MAG: hypothetical protein O3C40_04180 [Planctomycetota bacterium]|nr:hypothetical protein [Planctomycetota bacterium]
MKEVVETLRDIAGIFERLELPYAVIGGIAVRAYGIPRPTYDVDFTVAVLRERLAEVYSAIEDEGYTIPESYQLGWVDSVAGMPLVKFRFYIKDRGVDADIFLAETAFQKKLLTRRRLVETPDGNCWLASAEDLILLKLLASRPRDLVDVQDVLFTQGQLDEDYMRTWAAELGVEDRLRDAISQFHKENSGDQT